MKHGFFVVVVVDLLHFFEPEVNELEHIDNEDM